MLFSNMDFNFAHFEIEESFGLIWVKLQTGRFNLDQNFHFWYLKRARFKYGLYFCSFCL